MSKDESEEAELKVCHRIDTSAPHRNDAAKRRFYLALRGGRRGVGASTFAFLFPSSSI